MRKDVILLVRSFKSYSIEFKEYQSKDFKLPPVCPVCHQHGMFEPFSCAHHSSWDLEETAATTYFCNSCESFFFVTYVDDEILAYYPEKVKPVELSEHIRQLSPNFCDVYAQSCKADDEHLDLIAGMGYRRALEFLCKDYAISIHSEDRDKIVAMPLSQCIKKYIDKPVISQLAERVTWLGNDHAHYISKHTDKDLSDLKRILELVIQWIDLEINSQLAITEIQKA